MGRSQRANRAPRRFNEDRRGDVSYPSEQEYLYDWGSTWPSGSRRAAASINPAITYGGVTLTVTSLPGAIALLTVVGDTTVSALGSLGLDATLDDGTRVVERAVFSYGDVATAAAVAAVIADAVNAFPGINAAALTNEVTCTLVGTGIFNLAALTLGGP